MRSCEKYSDETVRIEKIIYLPAAIGCGVVSGELRDFFEDTDFDVLESVFGKIHPDIKSEIEAGHGSEIDDAIIHICDNSPAGLGFIAEFSTPVMEKCGQGTMFSWGHYHTKWVAGKYFSDVEKNGFAWARKSQREDAVSTARK